jgi:hypothetical protein
VVIVRIAISQVMVYAQLAEVPVVLHAEPAVVLETVGYAVVPVNVRLCVAGIRDVLFVLDSDASHVVLRVIVQIAVVWGELNAGSALGWEYA